MKRSGFWEEYTNCTIMGVGNELSPYTTQGSAIDRHTRTLIPDWNDRHICFGSRDSFQLSIAPFENRSYEGIKLTIPPEILEILSHCTVENNILYLPQRQLDRKIYQQVNKCLENLGGKWNRKIKGHIFDHDVTEPLENLLLTGETEDMKKKFQFFPTPRPLAEKLCDWAELERDSVVLEPSAGKGDLADVIYGYCQNITCIELNTEMERYLAVKPYPSEVGTDFLNVTKTDYWDRIVMNPPFTRQQDIDHVLHAYNLLKDGGVLVSVMSVSWTVRDNKKSVDFRDWFHGTITLCNQPSIMDVAKGTFQESGTMMPAKVIKVKKPLISPTRERGLFHENP